MSVKVIVVDICMILMLNSLDTLFILRTAELLEIATNRRLQLFIVGKSLTTKPFF